MLGNHGITQLRSWSLCQYYCPTILFWVTQKHQSWKYRSKISGYAEHLPSHEQNCTAFFTGHCQQTCRVATRHTDITPCQSSSSGCHAQHAQTIIVKQTSTHMHNNACVCEDACLLWPCLLSDELMNADDFGGLHSWAKQAKLQVCSSRQLAGGAGGTLWWACSDLETQSMNTVTVSMHQWTWLALSILDQGEKNLPYIKSQL